MRMKLSDIFEYYVVDTESGCWNWTRGKSKGYGAINANGRMWAAHRVSYERAKGPIPEGMSVCHSCDNPACINPAHLFIGTHRDNMLDKERKGRGNHVGLSGENNPNCKLSDARVIALLKDYIGGMLREDIAAKYGISILSVSDFTTGKSRAWLHGNHGCPTLQELKDARRFKHKAILTEDKVREIKALIASGMQGKDIAERFGVHKATISDIRQGKTWSDI